MLKNARQRIPRFICLIFKINFNCIKNIKSNQSGEVKHKTSEPIERVMHIAGKMTINPADPTIPLNI